MDGMNRFLLLSAVLLITALGFYPGCSSSSTPSNPVENNTISANTTAPGSTPTSTKSKTKTATPAAPVVVQSPDAPIINMFDANPAIISKGGLTSLKWDITNAQSISISPNVGSVSPTGTKTVSPGTSTTYVLTASNAKGSSSASVTIMVEKRYSTLLPVVMGFTIKPRTITENDTCSFAWDIYGADNVSIDTISGKTTTIISSKLTSKGELELMPTFTYPTVTAKNPLPNIPVSTNNYRVAATNITGTVFFPQTIDVLTTATIAKAGIPMVQDNVTVKATTVVPVIHWLGAEPVTVIKGNATTISWEVYQATKVLLNGVEVPAVGSMRISPAAAVTYTLTASNQYWTNTKTIGISVLAFHADWFEPLVK
jgi:hypothetical protein